MIARRLFVPVLSFALALVGAYSLAHAAEPDDVDPRAEAPTALAAGASSTCIADEQGAVFY